jgi:sugar phosphate isomerase/epimerase
MYNFCIKTGGAPADGFEEQVLAAGGFQINNLEVDDCMDGKSLADLCGRELEGYRRLLIEHNKKIVLLDSSIPAGDTGKYAMLFRKAHLLGVENIKARLDGSCTSDEQAAAVSEMLKTGKSYGIGVVFENNRSSPAEGIDNLAVLFKKLEGVHPGIIFNPLEYAALKKHPFFHAFYNTRLKPDIKFLRINDGLFENGHATLPGEGNAELKELASALLVRSFKGYFSLAPYLDKNSDDTHRTVLQQFKKILMSL